MLERLRISTGLRSVTLATSLVCANAWAQIETSPTATLDVAPEPTLAALLDAEAAPDGTTADERATLRRFYAAHAFTALWCDATGLLPRAAQLADALRAASLEGLQLTVAQHRALARMAAPVDATSCAEADLLLTQAFHELALRLGRGQLVPTTIDPLWHYALPEVDTVALLEAVAAGADVQPALRATAPRSDAYAGLVELLARYRAIAAAGGWPRIESKGASLRLGDDSEEVPVLRRRLLVTGDLAEGDGDATLFDEALEAAVRQFQQRHGLGDDGVVGRKTRLALSVPVEQRIAQILLNLERWRWLPRSLGARYVWVNTADFSLSLHENDRVSGTMRVIVGREERETPAFSEPMTHLVVNPSWSVPNKIAVEDLLPKQLHDPGYVARKRIRVLSSWSANAVELDPYMVDWSAYRNVKYLPFKFEQASGPDNSLGRVKFLMPNPYSVYLHDTPSRNLFSRTTRAFSSGCIRVEDPVSLAQFALGADWAGRSVEDMIAAGKTQYVRLPEPLPVYLVYLTGWRDDEGRAQFRDDIYELDRRLALALEALTPADVDRADVGDDVASPLSLLAH